MDFTTIKERIKEDLLLLTLFCYGLGFLYNVVFYNQFNVPIIYYIELTDMLLMSIKTVGIIIIYYILFEFVFYDQLGDVITKIYNWINRKNKLTKDEVYSWFTSLIYALSFLFTVSMFKTYATSQQMVFALYLAPLMTMWVGRLKVDKEIRLVRYTSSAICIYAIILAVVSSNSALVFKEKEYKIHLAFFYEDEEINTKDCEEQIYIGETSSTIFIYDKDADFTNVYNKGEIKHLKYLE